MYHFRYTGTPSAPQVAGTSTDSGNLSVQRQQSHWKCFCTGMKVKKLMETIVILNNIVLWFASVCRNRESGREAFGGWSRAATPVEREDVALPCCSIFNVGEKKKTWLSGCVRALCSCMWQATPRMNLESASGRAESASMCISIGSGTVASARDPSPSPIHSPSHPPHKPRIIQRCTTYHEDAASTTVATHA